MAVARAEGSRRRAGHIDGLSGEPSLQGYHLLSGARGDLLERLGRLDEARAELERAAASTRNLREREQLHERAARCAARSKAR
jgi:predicted RNA polymerase sigma factor